MYNSLAERGDAPPKAATAKVRFRQKTEGEDRMKKKIKYSKELPGRMYRFFVGYSEQGAPSFCKFARSIGATLEDIQKMREK